MFRADPRDARRSWQACRAITLCAVLIISTVAVPIISVSAQSTPATAIEPTGDDPSTSSQLVDVSASELPGRGTPDDPYRISNVSELQAIEDDLDASYVLVNDIEAGTTANANGGNGFNPIGTTTQPFTGTFNGQDYTITGLTIDRPSARATGMFARSEGEIRQVTLQSVSIVGDFNVGALVGDQRQGEIRSVTADGSVSGNGTVGGLVGQSYPSATIRDSSVTVDVSATRRNAGGVVGEADGEIHNISASGRVSGTFDVGGLVGTGGDGFGGLTIQNTSANVDVSTARQGAGGLVGSFGTGTIQNASATGDVTASGGLAGGLVGDVRFGSIQQSIATGAVTAESGGSVGGLVGRLGDDAEISNSSARGDVTGGFSVGGLAGQSDGTARNVSASGNVRGSEIVGGLVGRGDGTIGAAIAVGRVSGQQDVGGIAGTFDRGIIQDAYWDEQTTGQATSAGGTGLTTAEMSGNAALTNMTGLHFEETWQPVTGDYPELIVFSETTDRESGESDQTTPRVDVISSPSGAVSANTRFEVTYQITNTGGAAGAFTITVPQTSENITVAGFAGDIQGPNPDGSPPSTSTTSASPGQDVSVTVTYRTARNSTGTGNVTLSATPALSNTTDSATTSVELGEPTVPSTPRERAIQVASVDDPANITQDDITIAITRRDRGQQANGVTVTQNDITTMITLRDRAG